MHQLPSVAAPYQQPEQPSNEALLTLKVHEALRTLLSICPEWQEVLLQGRPGCFHAEDFPCNAALNWFACLTGRSLATFKHYFGFP